MKHAALIFGIVFSVLFIESNLLAANNKEVTLDEMKQLYKDEVRSHNESMSDAEFNKFFATHFMSHLLALRSKTDPELRSLGYALSISKEIEDATGKVTPTETIKQIMKYAAAVDSNTISKNDGKIFYKLASAAPNGKFCGKTMKYLELKFGFKQ